MEKKIVFCLLFILSQSFASKDKEPKRNVVSEIIKVECDSQSYSVAHFEATSTWHKNDVIHYIISGRVRPTLLIRHVNKPVKVTIDKQSFCTASNHSVIFNDTLTPQYTGFVIDKVFPFIDNNDDVYLTDDKDIILYEKDLAKYFEWKMDGLTSSTVKFSGTSKNYSDAKLDFSVTIRTKYGNSDKLPGYPTRANLSEFRFELKNLPNKRPPLKDPIYRYAAEIYLFTANADLPEANFQTRVSIDDEFTPGTFRIWGMDFKLPNNKGQPETKKYYASWKPVAYRSEDLSIESDAFARNNEFGGEQNKQNRKMSNKKATLKQYDGNMTWTIGWSKMQSLFGIRVTFGQPKDGGYKKYMTWSGMVGSGKTPLDQPLTSFAITVITLGLGGPVVVGILIGVLVALIRKLRVSNTPRSKYDQIN